MTDLEFVAPTQQAPPTPPPPQTPEEEEEEEEEEEDGEGPLEKFLRRTSASLSQPVAVAKELSRAAAANAGRRRGIRSARRRAKRCRCR